MKTLVNGILLHLFFTTICFAQWFWQNPLPHSNTIFTIQFINENTGWIAGDLGKIQITTDGGQTWEFQYSNTQQFIYDLFFIDELEGWAACHSGVIIHTKDGGYNWSTQDSGRAQLLTSIAFINRNEGWSVGDRNQLFHTIDGGQHWEIEQIGSYQNWLTSIYFFDEQNGWITGINEIYKTTDGGKNWISIPTTQLFSKLYFYSENIGWGIGGSGLISKTTDGGITWEDQLCTNQDNFYSITFIDELKGFVTDSFGKIFFTEDGGNNWEAAQLNKEWQFTFYDFACINQNELIVVGDAGMIYKSNNGGKSWSTNKHYGYYFFNDMQFINDKTGWIVGFGNSVAVVFNSSDGGNSWEKIFEINGGLEAVSFSNESNGWLAGDWGKIYHTSDGGENWDTLNAPEYQPFNDIKFFEKGIGYLCAPSSATIYKTVDTGKSWTKLIIPVSIDYQFYKIFFNDEKNGWIIAKEWFGDLHKILKTKDGGENWEIVYEIQTSCLWDLFFTDLNNGWVVGDSGIVLKTNNGGIDWQIIYSNRSYSNYCVFCKNQNEGFIGGQNGYIASTSDGGITWNSYQTWCNNMIEDIYISNDYKGIAVGGVGTILRNENVTLQIKDHKIYKNNFEYLLYQNYPNPFNPDTKIKYSIPRLLKVIIKIFDVLGNEIETLINEEKPAGTYELTWNAAFLPSGVYFYRIIAGNFIQTKKMLLLK